MRKSAFVRRVVVSLALLGAVTPQALITAAEQKVQPGRQVKVLPANTVLDVKLDSTGSFRGRIVDHSGNPLEGAAVAVKQGRTKVAESITDRNGEFAVSELKSGTYLVSSGTTEGAYRVWSEKSAPPGSMTRALLVQGENGARGQVGGEFGNTTTYIAAGALGLATASTIVAVDASRQARHNSNQPSSP